MESQVNAIWEDALDTDVVRSPVAMVLTKSDADIVFFFTFFFFFFLGGGGFNQVPMFPMLGSDVKYI